MNAAVSTLLAKPELGFDVVRVDWRDALLAYQRSTRSAARSSGSLVGRNWFG
jgi:hypothetical protein